MKGLCGSITAESAQRVPGWPSKRGKKTLAKGKAMWIKLQRKRAEGAPKEWLRKESDTYLIERDLRDRVDGDGVEYPEDGGGTQRDKGDGETLAKEDTEAWDARCGLFLRCLDGVDGIEKGEGRGNTGETGEARAALTKDSEAKRRWVCLGSKSWFAER
ncbi:hypothetical protein NM688_g3329 [Phlebia brevispora]|uniref:Uncharacterized protein n=1 Tax=Phlebia brevispora TaxID=194682 RepID=A0ACC1T5U0_9APHY|nr:hypothetical protein NM688_g3329 [Phlebia brevispora]